MVSSITVVVLGYAVFCLGIVPGAPSVTVVAGALPVLPSVMVGMLFGAASLFLPIMVGALVLLGSISLPLSVEFLLGSPGFVMYTWNGVPRGGGVLLLLQLS